MVEMKIKGGTQPGTKLSLKACQIIPTREPNCPYKTKDTHMYSLTGSHDFHAFASYHDLLPHPLPHSHPHLLPHPSLTYNLPGSKLSLRDKGVPHLNQPFRRGNHYVTVNVDIPSTLSDRQRQLLEEFIAEGEPFSQQLTCTFI